MNCTAASTAPNVGKATRISIREPSAAHVLAMGADLKNTVCWTHLDNAWISEPHGDLAEPESFRRFVESVHQFSRATDRSPEAVAYDLHPLYLSARYAKLLGWPCVGVQHHHAHAVSCAIDAGIAFPFVAIVCDGTGFGTDGRTWGGEVLLCNAVSFRRVAHLGYFPLPGGDAAARWTWRPAVALLRDAMPNAWRHCGLPAIETVDATELEVVSRQLDAALNTPQSSSVGRLFDAVAFLTGTCLCNKTEGQAAIAVEDAAAPACPRGLPPSPYGFHLIPKAGKPTTIDWRLMVRGIVVDVLAGRARSSICARFHATIVRMFADVACETAAAAGIDRVVLSGGCLNNRLLRVGLLQELERSGLVVGIHSRVPCGDAGLSLGQAVIASASVALGQGTTEMISCA